MNNPCDFDEITLALASTLKRLPLFQSRGSTGFAVIHADWPAFPTGNGVVCAVSTLAEFPADTRFFPVDFIDQYTLFVAEKLPTHDLTDPRALHVCFDDDDIRELITRGFAFGPNLVPNDPEVSVRRIEYAPGGYLRLSSKGRQAAEVFDQTSDLRREILEEVQCDLIEGRYTDAVRRASVLLETQLRSASGTSSYGQNLVDECFGKGGCLLPQEKCTLVYAVEIRAMYRRFFRYVRNEVAHCDPSFDLTEACRLMRRCSVLMEIASTLASAKKAC